MSRKVGVFLISLFVFVIIGAFGVTNNVVAAGISEDSSLYQKVYYYGVYQCYLSDDLAGGLIKSINSDDFDGVDSLKTNDGKAVKTIGLTDDVKMPVYSGFAARISCVDLFKNKVAKKIPTEILPRTSDNKQKELKNIFYQKISDDGAGKEGGCYRYYLNFNSYGGKGINNNARKGDEWNGTMNTDELCVTYDNNAKKWQIDVKGADSSYTTLDFNNGQKIKIPKFINFETGTNEPKATITLVEGMNNSQNYREVKYAPKEGDTASDILSGFGTELLNVFGANGNTPKISRFLQATDKSQNNSFFTGTVGFYSTCEKYEAFSSDGGVKCVVNGQESAYSDHFDNKNTSSSAEYQKPAITADLRNKIIFYFSNRKYMYDLDSDFYSSIKISQEEKYQLYTYYLEEFFGATNLGECRDESTTSLITYYKEVKLWDSSRQKYNPYCYPTFPSNTWQKEDTIKVNGVSDSGYFNRPVTIKNIIDALNAMEWPDNSSRPDSSGGQTEFEQNGFDKCYEAGLESQGWVICPTIRNMSEAISGMDGLIKDWLSVDIDQYKANGSTEGVWNIFRNIANIFMIIILLVIIFSQLTGYGIDNYGIKKMLPKLIVMAILINLSFIICELAVDVSNILGVGLDNMFRNFGEMAASANGDAASAASYQFAEFIEQLLGIAAGVGAGAEVVIGLATSGGGVVIIISILLVIIVALISVLIFFVMLGGRIIVIMLFTMIAPVAFACYILPNTQGLFKKWWNIFKAALIVYPICGALYGISFLVRGTVAGINDNFPMMLAAAITPYLPFLVLPALLKGAMNALGVVGGALTTLGNGLKSGISKGNRALQGTNAYKGAQETQRRNMTRWQAGLNRDGSEREVTGLGRFLRGGKSSMAGARAQYLKDKNTQAREDSYMNSVQTEDGRMMSPGFAAAAISQQKAAEAEGVKDYMTLINDQTRNGEDEAELFSMYRKYLNEGNKSGAIAAARIAGRRKDTASRFMASQLTGRGYDMNTEEGRKAYGEMMKANIAASHSNNGDLISSVAKEIATGENSKNFKESAPIGFEFVSQYNRDAGATGLDYEGWIKAGGSTNVDTAASHYLTKSSELVGAQNSTLNEIASMMAAGRFSNEERERLVRLAQDTINNRNVTGIWDTTKADNIYRIANGGVAPEQTTLNVPHNNSQQTESGILLNPSEEDFQRVIKKRNK